jgi:hypothetical protein
VDYFFPDAGARHSRRRAIDILVFPGLAPAFTPLALAIAPRELVKVALNFAHHNRVHLRNGFLGNTNLGIFTFPQRAHVSSRIVPRRGLHASRVPAKRRVLLVLHKLVKLVTVRGVLAVAHRVIVSPGRAFRTAPFASHGPPRKTETKSVTPDERQGAPNKGTTAEVLVRASTATRASRGLPGKRRIGPSTART